MAKISLQQFVQTSARGAGALRLNQTQGDAALALQRHRGGFLGRAVRWLRSQLHSASSARAEQASALSASRAFARAVEQQFGPRAAQTARAAGTLQPDKPLLSRNVRQVADELGHAHEIALRKSLTEAGPGRRAGIAFLSDLAANDLLSADATAEFLQKQEFAPHSVAEGVRQALLDGVRLSPKEGQVLADALLVLVEKRDGAAFFAHLQGADILGEPQVGKLLSHLADTDVARGAKSLFQLTADGLFASLAPEYLAVSDSHTEEMQLDYQVPTPPLEKFKGEFLRQLRADALNHPTKSLTPETLAPYVQDGKFDAKAFLDSPPRDAQFAKDFARDFHNAAEYKINGNTYRGEPEAALQALWDAAGQDSERFSRLGNLLTQNSLLAPLASSIKHSQASGRLEPEMIMFLQRDDSREFAVANQTDGSLQVQIADTERLTEGSRFLVQNHDGDPLIFTAAAPAQGEKRRAVAFSLSPQNKVDVRSAELSLRFQAPLSALAFDADNN